MEALLGDGREWPEGSSIILPSEMLGSDLVGWVDLSTNLGIPLDHLHIASLTEL